MLFSIFFLHSWPWTWFCVDYFGVRTFFVRLRLTNPTCVRTLSEVGVDVFALVDLADFIFGQKSSLSFASFMDAACRNGTCSFSVGDMQQLPHIGHHSGHAKHNGTQTQTIGLSLIAPSYFNHWSNGSFCDVVLNRNVDPCLSQQQTSR